MDNVVTFGISPELNAYRSERSRQLFARLEDELAALPGVTGVTTALVPLLAGSNGSDVQVEGFQAGTDIDSNSRFNEVGAGYFRTMGVPLIAGRKSRRPICSARPRSRSSTRRSRRSSTSAATPSASASAAGARASAGHRDRRPGAERQVQRSRREVPPLFFRPIPAGRRGRTMTFYAHRPVDPSSFLVNIRRS